MGIALLFLPRNVTLGLAFGHFESERTWFAHWKVGIVRLIDVWISEHVQSFASEMHSYELLPCSGIASAYFGLEQITCCR